MGATLTKCKACGGGVVASAKACPKCGAPRSSFSVLRVVLVLVGLSVAAVCALVISFCGHVASKVAASEPEPVVVRSVSSPIAAPTTPDDPRPAWLREEIERVSPRGLLEAYRKNGVAADAKYKGKAVEVIGVVALVRRDQFDKVVVNLATGEGVRHVRCEFPEAAAQEVAELEAGQLVAIRGTGGGDAMGSVVLRRSTIAWRGDRPSDKKPKAERERDALRAARSSEMCVAEAVLAAKDGVPEEQRKSMSKLQARARADMEKLGVTPLPCMPPLGILAFRCEGAEDRGPECRHPQTEAVLASTLKVPAD